MLSRSSGKRFFKSEKLNVHIRRSFALVYPQSISMKFNSQWNFGKNNSRWPNASTVSSSQHLSTRKSSHCDKIRLAQHCKLSAGGVLSLHSLQSSLSPSIHNSLSRRIVLIPFCTPSLACIFWTSPFQIVSLRSFVFFPPSFRFKLSAHNASGLRAWWFCELSNKYTMSQSGCKYLTW